MASIKVYPGDPHAVFKETLRKYSLRELLSYISAVSAIILSNKDQKNVYTGVRNIELSFWERDSIIPTRHDILVNGWNLLDLAYYAILYTNDYRGKPIENDNELALLINLLTVFQDSKEAELIESFKDDFGLFCLYLFGFGGEQFRYQELYKVIDSSAREAYILFETSKKMPSAQAHSQGGIEVETIIRNEFGVPSIVVRSSLLLAFFLSLINGSPFDGIDPIKWDYTFSKDDYKSVVDRYVADYSMIRKSENQRQELYVKPYIKTDKGDIVSVNAYLSLFLYEHCIFWICRDYYRKCGSQAFPSYFGILFEEYFHEVLTNLLAPSEYSRIKEGNAKSVDWKIEIDNYCFLVEQKSSLAPLSIKQQETCVERIVTFGKRVVFEAVEQLWSTEKQLGVKCIKIILLYEDYIDTHSLDGFLLLEDSHIQNDGFIWMMTIREMEMLLCLYKDNKLLFHKVVQEKIIRDQDDATRGSRISDILKENCITYNEYLNKNSLLKYYKEDMAFLTTRFS